MHTINAGDSQCDLRYILGLINSALLNYFFQSMNPERGETLAEVKKEHVEKLPIMNVPAKQQAAIIGKVDEIMALKKKDTAANTNELEREIDFLVYEVFNLTPAEIELVERATAQKSSGITDTPDTVASL